MWIVMLYNKLYCAKNKKGVRTVQSAELHFIPHVFFEGLLYLTFELLGGKKKVFVFTIKWQKVKCLNVEMLNENDYPLL